MSPSRFCEEGRALKTRWDKAGGRAEMGMEIIWRGPAGEAGRGGIEPEDRGAFFPMGTLLDYWGPLKGRPSGWSSAPVHISLPFPSQVWQRSGLGWGGGIWGQERRREKQEASSCSRVLHGHMQGIMTKLISRETS